ncbi:MAG: type I-F CRISPR-associated protein Csy3 [Pseudomonadales bacterium]|nr:type I-F CRISPR-associated protein Csy3 [Pseudomonadales bacterium]
MEITELICIYTSWSVTMTDLTFPKLPAVMAVQRSYMLSDAIMFSMLKDGTTKPVDVIRHGVRATNNSKPKNNTNKEVNENEVRNLQVTDTAKLDVDAEGMQVEFTISFTDLANSLSAIAGKNDKEVKESFENFVERAKGSDSLTEIARRYARNILNGRWLWRNRQYANTVEISVSEGDQLVAKEDALNISLMSFGDYSEGEKALGERIAEGLKGEALIKLAVVARVEFLANGAVEVFPSQNYLTKNKPSGFARSLYALKRPTKSSDTGDMELMGIAAIRDQKVANAIRTVDTWYPGNEDVKPPIAVEIFGANIGEQKFFRKGCKKDGFHFMCRLNVLDLESDDAKFMIACLVRGGVYAESEK